MECHFEDKPQFQIEQKRIKHDPPVALMPKVPTVSLQDKYAGDLELQLLHWGGNETEALEPLASVLEHSGDCNKSVSTHWAVLARTKIMNIER